MHRWDAVSSASSVSSDDSASPAIPCEQLIKQHESLQQQHLMACVPRRDLVQGQDPKYQAEQARQGMQKWLTELGDEQQQQDGEGEVLGGFLQPLKKPAKGGVGSRSPSNCGQSHWSLHCG